ncbi:glycoside hydrolase family 18 [Neobacillus bataviensis LMG 21833]|uniref:Glycoside hydrolase family 18 n=1 Tax=Neobacillus bataviensis LMG 21833 TaxID=1117379 RepID=K6DNR9_9BACI|nr:hypothetical protein [Neobacillus bataviensis]EKN69823.1 glycoside hydrolase family 18 [Neobacillus bataviensis LMG 21833]
MEKSGYRSFTIMAISIAMLLMSSCSQSQKIEKNSSTNKTPREVLGFYTEKEGTYPGSQPIVNSHFNSLSIIAPFWYKLDDQRPGSLIDSVTADHKKKVIQSAHKKHLKVYMVVHNLFYETVEKGKQVASNVLDHDNDRHVFIQNIRNEINQFNYDGIILTWKICM